MEKCTNDGDEIDQESASSDRHQFGDAGERASGGSQHLARPHGFHKKPSNLPAARLFAEDTRIGPFATGGILAGGFAHMPGRLCDVE